MNPADTPPLVIAQRIRDLQNAIDSAVRAKEYQAAAWMLDERKDLEDELSKIGNETIRRNVEAVLHGMTGLAPMTDMLDPKSSDFDESLLGEVKSAPVPIRWVVHESETLLPGTLRKRVDTSSLQSPYFMAKFPIISSKSLHRATHVDEWLKALIREKARCGVPVVWICSDLFSLNTIGVIDTLLGLFQDRSFEFVACAGPQDDVIAQRIIHIPGVFEVRPQL
jgi:hypothetical protein